VETRKKKMARQEASAIVLSARTEKILRENASSRTIGENLRSRSEIVILASEGKSNTSIAKEMEITKKKVIRWRDRYSAATEGLMQIELEKPHKLRSEIEKVLSDEPRPGAPVTYQGEQVALILLVACESPEKYDLPFSHWTPGTLRKQVIELGIVDDISERQVGRFLKMKGNYSRTVTNTGSIQT
jgi:transposase